MTAFLLLTFLPLVLQQISHERNLRWPFILLALPLILISSLYFDYVMLSSVVACWVMLYITQLIPLRRFELIYVLGSIALGIGLNLLKNLIYFGPKIFFEELFYVVGNRTVGWPSQHDLIAFYAENGIVHHGSRPPNFGAMKAVIGINFDFPGLGLLILTAGIAILLSLSN